MQIWREGDALVVRGAMDRIGSCGMPDRLEELETTVLRFVPIDRLTAAAEEQARRLGVDRRRCNYKTDYRTGPPRRCWPSAPAQTVEVAAFVDAASLVRRANEFGKEVSRAETSGRTASLEDFLRRGNELAAELRPIIEQLSDYRSVEPDTRFFSKVAGEIGTTQDRLYFDYMLKVRPNGYWPAYLMNPKAPVAGLVKARLSALERGAQVVREDCVGGQ